MLAPREEANDGRQVGRAEAIVHRYVPVEQIARIEILGFCDMDASILSRLDGVWCVLACAIWSMPDMDAMKVLFEVRQKENLDCGVIFGIVFFEDYDKLIEVARKASSAKNIGWATPLWFIVRDGVVVRSHSGHVKQDDIPRLIGGDSDANNVEMGWVSVVQGMFNSLLIRLNRILGP